jgi:hypothetical protein
MTFLYDSEAEIERVVRDFEACTTPATDFHHREHLTVAVWYLQTLSPNETVKRMRAALLRFLDHHGVDQQKYSEPVTVYWIETVAEKLKEMGTDTSLVEKCNQVITSSSLQAHKQASRVGVEE